MACNWPIVLVCSLVWTGMKRWAGSVTYLQPFLETAQNILSFLPARLQRWFAIRLPSPVAIQHPSPHSNHGCTWKKIPANTCRVNLEPELNTAISSKLVHSCYHIHRSILEQINAVKYAYIAIEGTQIGLWMPLLLTTSLINSSCSMIRQGMNNIYSL